MSNNNQRVKKFYVYGHYTIENKLFYIGVGTILNLQTNKEKSKYSRAYHSCNRTKFWNNIKDKYGIQVKILEEFYTKEESLNKEKELIALFKRQKDGGFLCNLSEGGEIGPIGYKKPMSEEQKKKLSEIKSLNFFIYNKEGDYIKSIKTIKNTAKFCGVTYNAIHSCLSTKNYSNKFFIFKEYKGLNIGYTNKDLNFKSALSKKIISKCINTNELKIHESIYDCSKYLGTDRKNLKSALKNNRICKKHKVFFERTISSQAS